MKHIYLVIALLAAAVTGVNAQDVAFKTNLLYGGLTLTPNLGIEVGLGRKTTLDISAGYNPWKLDDKAKKLVHSMGQIEFRYWFSERFRGIFIGAHGLGSRFNIAGHNLPMLFGDGSKKFQYQGTAFGGGLSVGYQFRLAKKWNLELNAGGGYARINYDKYDCKECDRFVGSGHKNYFGLTRAGVSIIFLIFPDK